MTYLKGSTSDPIKRQKGHSFFRHFNLTPDVMGRYSEVLSRT